MALKLNLAQTPIGIALPEAYARISNYDGSKSELLVRVAVYATADARGADARPIESRQHSLDPATLSGPLMPALYDALKTLPEYAGAMDA